MYGPHGLVQKSVFPLHVLFIDNLRNGKPAWIGTIQAAKAFIKSIKTLGRSQVITFHASEWTYHNGKTQVKEPSDPKLVPVTVCGFDEDPDKASEL
jgi:hypothetical protein